MNENKFHYVYSAPTAEERKEIDSIRRQYEEEKGASKLDRLRKLHARVKGGATAWSLCLGVVGCLIFGLGLAMILEWGLIVFGVLAAAIGGVPMGLAYPVYALLIKKNKEKYGGEILRLSKELLNNE